MKDATTPLLSATAVEQYHSKEERDAVYNKISWKLLPLAFVIALVCFVDRTNISLAGIDMMSDLKLTKSEFGTASSVFFVTYMLFQVPSNAVLIKVGGPLWLGTLLIGWGITASLTAFAKNATQLYILRLVLGVFEAGSFPGLTYYLALYFPEAQMAKVIGIFNAGITVGMGLSSPVGGAILLMDGMLRLHGWQWLFLIEGLPAVLIGVVTIWCYPRSPGTARWLSDREQDILLKDRCTQQQQVPMHEQVRYLVKSVVLSWQMWVFVLTEFLVGTTMYTIMFWTPIWINDMVKGGGLDFDEDTHQTVSGSEGVRAAILSTIPYGFASIAVVLFGWTSEKLNDRKLHCLFLWVIGGGVFMALPWMAEISTVLGFFALIMGHVGVNGTAGPWLSMAMSYMTNENKSFGIAWLNSLGNISGLVGPMLTGVLADKTGSYKYAIVVVGGMLVLDGVVVGLMRDSVRVDAKKKKELGGTTV